jgi:hypothetical protein
MSKKKERKVNQIRKHAESKATIEMFVCDRETLKNAVLSKKVIKNEV